MKIIIITIAMSLVAFASRDYKINKAVKLELGYTAIRLLDGDVIIDNQKSSQGIVYTVNNKSMFSLKIANKAINYFSITKVVKDGELTLIDKNGDGIVLI